jgi:hypothetical protein
LDIPGSKGCTLDTFKGMSSIRRKRFDRTSNAPSKLEENDIGSDKIASFLKIIEFCVKRYIAEIKEKNGETN